MTHKPVLIKEVLQYLDPKPNENVIDGTIGQAGHALEILKKNGPSGKVLGIDLDKSQIENSALLLKDFKERVVLVNDSYANIKEIVKKINFEQVHGIVLDLGFSSWQLENFEKGLSFQVDGPLDMRYDFKSDVTAEKIVNEYSKEQIEKIIKDFGEERFARQIAKKIAEQRNAKRIKSTFELKHIIEEAVPRKFHHGNIHVATRTFQALRIAVNRELDNLQTFLPQAFEILPANGRLVIISFHSLEDRIVKQFFKEKEKNKTADILTKKPVIASNEELSTNPRSRSAKLRAIIKC